VLLLYPYLPYPGAPHGSAQLMVSLLERLRSRAEITLLCAYRPREKDQLGLARSLVHRLVPVERPFAADMKGVDRLEERGWTLARISRTGWPIPVVKLWRPAIRQELAREISRGDYDLFHAELTIVASYAALLPPDIPAVLVDHEDGRAGTGSSWGWERYLRQVYPRYDRILALCSEDASRISTILGGREVLVRPPAILLPGDRPWNPEPHRILFVGSASFAPNRDALEWIATSILPRIRALDVRCKLVCAGFGHEEPQLAERLRALGAEIIPFAEDLGAEFLRASVLLAPIRLGRGVRIKVLEALAHGVPVVTTQLGVRGLGPLDLPVHWIKETAEALARVVVSIAADPGRERLVAGEVRRHVHERHSPEVQAEMTYRHWEDVLRQVRPRRRNPA
jgi:glycosyltransferase involved in cell wall biosynthesis